MPSKVEFGIHKYIKENNMNKVKLVFVSALCLVLLGCATSNKLSGTYTTLEGTYGFHFKSNGRVGQSMLGNQFAEFDYDRDGDIVTIYMIEGTGQIFTIQDNGDLIGPAGLKLTKRR